MSEFLGDMGLVPMIKLACAQWYSYGGMLGLVFKQGGNHTHNVCCAMGPEYFCPVQEAFMTTATHELSPSVAHCLHILPPVLNLGLGCKELFQAHPVGFILIWIAHLNATL